MTSSINATNFQHNQPIIYSTLISILVILPVFIGMFFLLGKYIQTKFSILSRNTYATIPLGFIAFALITFITYTPLIIFRLSGSSIGIVYVVIECLKDLSIFVFLWLNRQWVKYKVNWVKVVSMSFAIIGLVSIPIIFFLATHHGQNPLEQKVPVDIHRLFYGGTIEKYPWLSEKIYNSWYMFSSVIWYITNINGAYMMWIVQPALVSAILLSTICAVFRILLKRLRTLGFVGVGIVAISIMMLTYEKYGDHAPTIGVVASTLILILLSWETLKTPKVRNFIIMGIAGISILIFSWSALWIYTSYMVVLIGVYIYKQKPKPTLLILFTIVFIGFILSASIHSYFIVELKRSGGVTNLQHNGTNDIRSIGSTIGMILSVMLGFVLLWLRNKNIEVPLDKILFRFRKWWMPLAFAVLFLVSIILWSTSEDKNAWLNFGLDNSFLGSLSSVPHLPKVMYAFYWVLLVCALISTIFTLKSRKRLEIDSLLILIGFVTTILFFSPFTASLVKMYLAPKAIFIDMQWVSIFPMVIGFILKIIKFIKHKMNLKENKKAGREYA